MGWSSIVATVSAEETKKTENKSDDENSAVRKPTAVTTDFENFKPGTIDGQNDWKSSGSASYGTGFDVEITDNNSLIAPKSFGFHSLRLSNAFTSDSTAEQTFAGLLPNEGGETSADNLGEKRGERMRLFTSEWEFASADPTVEQFGLSVVASPTRRDGSQMSYVRMVDTPEGVGVFFKEYRNGAFSEISIASGLDRTQAHKIRLDINFKEGAGNDLVQVYIDNELKHEGTTWEDFYRENNKSQPPTIDTISFNTDGSPYPANRGKGFLIDNIEINSLLTPSVLSITRQTPTSQITNSPGSPVPPAPGVIFRVIFNVPVTGVDAADFSFIGSTATGPISVTNINTNSPFTTYDITVTGYTGDGIIDLNVIDNDTITNGGDPLGGVGTSGAGDGSYTIGDTYIYDTTAPFVSSIVLPGANPTNATGVTFTVTFSENVQGVDPTDFSLATSGTSGSIGSVGGSGAIYSVTVTGISGNGTLGLNVLDDNTITDFVSPTPYSLSMGATSPNYTIDNNAPSVSIIPASGPFTTATVNFTAQFSETVNNFDIGDIAVVNGNKSDFVAVDGDTYTFNVTRTVDGTVTVDIGAGVAEDAAANPNTAAAQASVTFDTLAPTPVVSTTSNSPTNVSPIPFTVNFGEAVNGFTAVEVTVSGGAITPGSFTGVDGNSAYSFTVTPNSANVTVSVSVGASVAQDTAGNNNNSSGAPVDVTYDATPPTPVVSTTSVSPTNVSPIPFTVNFGEAVNNFTASDVVPTNGTVSNFVGANGATTYTFDVTPSGPNVTVSVTIAASVAQDTAGNNNNVSNTVNVDFDNANPTVVSIVPSSGTFSNSPINFTVTFNEPVSDFEDVDLTDVTLGGTALPNTFAITGGPTVYNVAVGGMSGDGSVTIQIPAGAAIDGASNPNTISAVATVQRAATQVLTSANSASKGWAYTNDQTIPPTVIPYNYVQGSTGQPLGEGSARFATVLSTEGKHLAHFGPDFLGVRLDKVTELTFDTYTTGSDTISLQLGADYDLTDNVTGFQGRLVYVPTQNGTITPNTWQTWDATSGKFWATQAPMNATNGTGCPMSTPCTRAELLTKFPNVGINTNAGLGSVGFKIGSGSSNAEVFVDNFTIGVNGNDSTFDFEPILPTVTVEQAVGQNDPTNASPINFTAEFSENVTGFDTPATDVSISGSATASATIIPVDGDTYTIAISGMLSGDTVTVTIPQGAAQGAEGSNLVSTSSVGGNSVTYNVPTVSIAAALPGAEPSTAATFTVTLTGSNPSSVTVSYSLGGGTATGGNASGGGNDYNNASGIVTFNANDNTPQTISVPVFDDAVFEPTENFTATLSGPTNATLGTSSALNTITDDGASVVSINPTSSANEGDNVAFTVSINEPNANIVTVNYTFADVSTSATDRTAPSGTVMIPANALSAPINVPALNDNIDEPNETFTITLTSADNGATINPSANIGTGTIVDTDVLTVYVNDDFADPTSGNDPDGVGPATNFGLDAFATVQGGVTGVAVGGTVIVYNGTYIEQVLIDKNLTVDGQSTAGTIVQLPNAPAVGLGNNYINLEVKNGATVTASDLTITGPRTDNGCSPIGQYGVFVTGGATFNISNAAVNDIRYSNQAFYGCQSGIAIRAGQQIGLNTTGTVSINNVSFAGYQKSGVIVDNIGSTGTITNSTFTGFGPEIIAQNAIQISRGATATITGNTISNNLCSNVVCGPDFDDTQSTGVLLFGATSAQITGNTFTNNDDGVISYGNSTATVNNNTFVDSRYYGIYIGDGNVTFNNNTLTKTNTGAMNVGIGISSYTGDAVNAVGNAESNTIVGANVGIEIRDDDVNNVKSNSRPRPQLHFIEEGDTSKPEVNSGISVVPNLTANYNRIISINIAIANPENNTADLQFNWWGCNAGPGMAGCGAVVGTGANFTPWVVLTASATSLTVNPGGMSTVSADLSEDNLGNPLAQSIPNTPVAFTATEGTMSACTADPEPSAINCLLSNNLVDTSTFTSNSNDDATVTVTVDNQPIPIAIAVTEPTFSINDVTVNENAGTATFTVTLTGTSVETATVNVGTTDGTANFGSDFGAVTPISLSFMAGGPTQTQDVTVPITDDTVFEGATAETYTVNLSGATNSTISDATGDGAITDNDTAPAFSINDVTVNEGAGTAIFTVTLTGSTQLPSTTVNVGTTDGTANLGSDFGAVTPTSLSFGPQTTPQTQNVTVPITDDGVYEGVAAETYTVNLSSPTNATISDPTGNGAITENETCVYTVTPTSPNPANFPIAGGTGTFSVSVTTGCTWTAVDNTGFVTSTSTGSGSGTGSYSVAANVGGARSETFTVSGVNNGGNGSFIVNQGAAPVQVFIPTTLETLTTTNFNVPIRLNSDTTGRGIIAFQYTLTFDPNVVQYSGPTGLFPYSGIGTANNWTLTVNANNVTGTLTVGGFNANPMSGPATLPGTMMELQFTSIGGIGTFSNLNFTSFQFNGAAEPMEQTTNGRVTIVSGTISGAVNLAITPTTPVPGTNIVSTGATPTPSDITDSNGLYSLSGFGAGPYTVTPSKTAQPLGTNTNGVDIFDPALIAQRSVGIITFSALQDTAADVSGDTIVDVYDAALVAQFTVGITNPGVAGTWKFIPASRSYSSGVLTNYVNEDYDAILMGDVNGDWNPTGTPALTDGMETLRSNATGVPVQVTAPTQTVAVASNFSIPISVDDTTGNGIISYQFDLVYDPNVIALQGTPCNTSGTISSGLSAFCNQIAPNTLRVGVFGTTPISGQGILIKLQFNAIGMLGNTSPLNIVNFRFNNGVPDDVTFNGQLTIGVATSANASVGGRLTDANGNGIGKTTVTVTAGNGATRSVVTNSFGNYAFADLPVGQTYVITVNSKKYRFTPESRVVTVNGDATDVDFTADSQ